MPPKIITDIKKPSKKKPPKIPPPIEDDNILDIKPEPLTVIEPNSQPLIMDETEYISRVENINDYNLIKDLLNEFAFQFEQSELINSILEKYKTVDQLKYIFYMYLHQSPPSKSRPKLSLRQFYNIYLRAIDERQFLEEISKEPNFLELKKKFKGLKNIFPHFKDINLNKDMVYLYVYSKPIIHDYRVEGENIYTDITFDVTTDSTVPEPSAPEPSGMDKPISSDTNKNPVVKKKENIKPILEEDYNKYVDKLDKSIKDILLKYNDEQVLKYIIKLFLSQYSYSLTEFYNKFLLDPRTFLILRELRSIFYNIAHDNKICFTTDEDYEHVKQTLVNFKDKYTEYNNIISTILSELNKKLLLKLITEYVSQASLTLDEYYMEFISDPIIKIKLNNYEKPMVDIPYLIDTDIGGIFNTELPFKIGGSFHPIYKDTPAIFLKKYIDPVVLNDILKLFSLQDTLTAKEFYDKFLSDPAEFDELREFRKLTFSIISENKKGIPISTSRLQLSKFKDEYIGYNTVLSSILNELNDEMLIKFINEYMVQSSLTLLEFYNIFKQNIDNDLPTIINNITPQIIETVDDCVHYFTVVPWNKEKVLNTYICKVDTDITKYIIPEITVSIKNETYYKVNKNYYDLQCDTRLYKEQDKTVLNFYNRMTKAKVINFKIAYQVRPSASSTYICKVDTDISKYIYVLDNIIINNEKYYKVNSKYLSLENDIQLYKEIRNNIINFYDKDRNNLVINFKVTGIIIQNEELFKEQQLFLQTRNKTPIDVIHNILKEPVKNDVKDYAFNIIKNYFIDDGEYIQDDKFITELIDVLSKSSTAVESFAKNLGNILVYLSPRGFERISYKSFRKHIKLGYYTPSDLLSLHYSAKAPEIFGVDSGLSSKNISSIKNTLKSSIEDFVEDFVDDLYKIRNRDSRYKPRSTYRHGDLYRFMSFVNIKDWRGSCDNYKEMIAKIDSLAAEIEKSKEILDNLMNKKEKNDKDREQLKILDSTIKNLTTNRTELILKTKEFSLDSLGYYLKYVEDDNTYCLNSDQIRDRIQNGDLTNPHTGKKLTD